MARVSIKSPTKWKDHKNLHLGISMGSGHHSGEALRAIVSWANQQQFEHGLIDVSDTLNRYSFMREGVPEAHAHDLARRQGIEWRQQNDSILERLKMPHRVVHWDHWLQDRRFDVYKQAFEVAYESDPGFRTAIMRDIQAFFQRKYGQNLHDRSERDIGLSKQFYLEELAALSIQFEDYPCAEIYPGRELESLKLVRRGEISDVPTGIANATFAKMFVYDFETPPTGPSKAKEPVSRTKTTPAMP